MYKALCHPCAFIKTFIKLWTAKALCFLHVFFLLGLHSIWMVTLPEFPPPPATAKKKEENKLKLFRTPHALGTVPSYLHYLGQSSQQPQETSIHIHLRDEKDEHHIRESI